MYQVDQLTIIVSYLKDDSIVEIFIIFVEIHSKIDLNLYINEILLGISIKNFRRQSYDIINNM